MREEAGAKNSSEKERMRELREEDMRSGKGFAVNWTVMA